MAGWRPGWWPKPHPKPQPKPHDPASGFNPVLLIPGIGGSILNAVSQDGKTTERIWVRLYNADQEFRTKLWSKYNPETGKTESLDRDSHIEVPDDNHGLYSCDILDPDVSVPLDAVCYYHHMIREMHVWGFKDGESLFGFGYDFRQSNRLPEALDRLRAKLEAIVARTGRRVDVVTHSMGGLLFKSLVALHPHDVQRLVRKWVSIAAPFRGAPGFIMDTLLTGVEFLKGWQKSLFITKWTMHQLMVECPSVYELMADYSFHWGEKPELRIVRRKGDKGVRGDNESEAEGLEEESRADSESSDGSSVTGCSRISSDSSGDSSSSEWLKECGVEKGLGKGVLEEGVGDGVVEQRFRHLPDILEAMDRALEGNKIEVGGKTVPLPFNRDIVKWADETRRIWAKATLPPGVDFYTIYGTGLDTPFHSKYGSSKDPLNDLPDILHTDVSFDCVHGDGTVPVESALADGFPALFRVGVPGAEHRELLRLPRVFSLLHFFLEVSGKDALYDPLSDFVIVPRPLAAAEGDEEGEEEEFGEEDGKGRRHGGEEGRKGESDCGGCRVEVQVEVGGQAVRAVVCESDGGKVSVSLTASSSSSPDRAEVGETWSPLDTLNRVVLASWRNVESS